MRRQGPGRIFGTHFRKAILILAAAGLMLALTACQLPQTLAQLLASATPTPTMTATPTATFTATATSTTTATATSTATATATATNTPVPTRRPSTATPAAGSGSSGECDGGNTAFEADVRGLINSERANAGLAPLKSNGALTAAARTHSKDMATANYFSHTGSDGSDPFTRMSAAGYSFSAAAENIYAGNGPYNTPYSAVDGWMGSEGHRENILNSAYTEIGVGYWCNNSSTYGGYFTADFGRP